MDKVELLVIFVLQMSRVNYSVNISIMDKALDMPPSSPYPSVNTYREWGVTENQSRESAGPNGPKCRVQGWSLSVVDSLNMKSKTALNHIPKLDEINLTELKSGTGDSSLKARIKKGIGRKFHKLICLSPKDNTGDGSLRPNIKKEMPSCTSLSRCKKNTTKPKCSGKQTRSHHSQLKKTNSLPRSWKKRLKKEISKVCKINKLDNKEMANFLIRITSDYFKYDLVPGNPAENCKGHLQPILAVVYELARSEQNQEQVQTTLAAIEILADLFRDSLNQVHETMGSPLHSAAEFCKTGKIVQCLVDCGAEIDIVYGDFYPDVLIRRTPLVDALLKKQFHNATVLLNAGANPKLGNSLDDLLERATKEFDEMFKKTKNDGSYSEEEISEVKKFVASLSAVSG